MIFGEVGRSNQTTSRCCFWHQGGRGRGHGGRGYRGDSYWLPQPRCSLSLLFSDLFGLFGWMKWTNGLKERTNHNPPYCLWESLPVLRVVKCLWRVNELLMFLQNQTTQQECVHTSVLSTRSTSACPLTQAQLTASEPLLNPQEDPLHL